MVKHTATQGSNPDKHIQNILITQARPDSEKSPYFEMARKFNVKLDFHPFIRVEGIPAKDFRKQKIEIPTYSAVIFTSRNAIDHFFRTCDEMKITVSQHTKYFCITEAVALYLQDYHVQKDFSFHIFSDKCCINLCTTVRSKGNNH